MSRVAVIGGGLFGGTTAIDLARAGHDVVLHEAKRGLLLGATAATQARVHAGFHYPRSFATATEVMRAQPGFMDRYGPAIDRSNAHYYVLAAGSLVAPTDYFEFCDKAGLSYTAVVSHPLVREDTTDAVLRVDDEAFIDVRKLRNIMTIDLRSAGVAVHLQSTVTPWKLASSYDYVVDATYGALGRLDVQYEVTETVLVKLGKHFAHKSFVVVDGPFVSLDPVPGTDFHTIYHVEHSVRARSTTPQPPAWCAGLVNEGPRATPHTNMPQMEQGVRQFLRGIGMPEYHGSMWTVRPVLTGVEHSDERPTIVERERDGNLIKILSGKMVTAVDAAHQVVELVGV